MAFAVTVDLVVLTIRDGELVVLVVRRGGAPYRGRWALPGGFVEEREGLLDAARRELREETGLADATVHLEQLATYGDPRRDPRLRVVSVAYLALAAEPAGTVSGERRLRDDLATGLPSCSRAPASWRSTTPRSSPMVSSERGRNLSTRRWRRRSAPTSSPSRSSGSVYEVVWGTDLDPRNFHRKVTGSPGFLEPTGRLTSRNGGRPAQLYRGGDAQVLNPPIAR